MFSYRGFSSVAGRFLRVVRGDQHPVVTGSVEDLHEGCVDQIAAVPLIRNPTNVTGTSSSKGWPTRNEVRAVTVTGNQRQRQRQRQPRRRRRRRSTERATTTTKETKTTRRTSLHRQGSYQDIWQRENEGKKSKKKR